MQYLISVSKEICGILAVKQPPVLLKFCLCDSGRNVYRWGNVLKFLKKAICRYSSSLNAFVHISAIIKNGQTKILSRLFRQSLVWELCCNCVCLCPSSSPTGRLSWENRPWTSVCPPSLTPPPPSLFWGRGTSTAYVTTARSASWRSWSSTPAASCRTPQVNQDAESLGRLQWLTLKKMFVYGPRFILVQQAFHSAPLLQTWSC